MKYRYHPDARTELAEALGYYQKIDQDLADSLNQIITKAIAQIIQNPEIRPLRQEQWRRHNLERFPYYLPYCIENGEVIILAIAHQSRKPGYWKNRI